MADAVATQLQPQAANPESSMSLAPQTRAFLGFLAKNPLLRAQIAAGMDSTILYAGQLIQPAWMEIADMKKVMPQLAAKKTLPEVLQTIRTPGAPFPNLLEWVKSLDSLTPWEHNGFIGWRALSGIFASNARGKVSFVIGSGVSKARKVFAATEVSVLTRNPHVDEITRNLVEYYQSCIRSGRTDMNLSFISA
jgi:hypothetical protein